MYEMYPDWWGGPRTADRESSREQVADRPRRRARRTHEDRPAVIRNAIRNQAGRERSDS
jgi:hypothetical protein